MIHHMLPDPADILLFQHHPDGVRWVGLFRRDDGKADLFISDAELQPIWDYSYRYGDCATAQREVKAWLDSGAAGEPANYLSGGRVGGAKPAAVAAA